MNKADGFSQFAAAVAHEVLGDHNKTLSSKDELRFGKQGSLSVDLTKGTFFDHSEKIGGGVLWFVERQTGRTVDGGQAVEWLREHGFHVDNNEPPPNYANGSGERKAARLDKHGNYLPNRVPDDGELTAAFDYRDAQGEVAYQVVRYDWPDPTNEKGHSKTFVQRRPDPSKKHGWDWTVKGLTPLPYRLPELLEDVAQGYEVFLVEGERKVDRLRDLGVPATCNSGGAGKFPDALLDWFRGARLITLGDNDEAGKKHAQLIGNKLHGIAEYVKHGEIAGLGPKEDVVNWLDAGGTVDQLYEIAARARSHEATSYESRFAAVTWFDMDAPGPEHEWLIKKVLTRGEVSMMAGASQSGKTFLALDQAMAVARGIEWFGNKSRQGGVVYCAAESAKGVRRKRLKAYRQHYQIEAENIPFVLLQSPLDLYSNDDHTDALIEEIRHWSRTFTVPLELIVIDTLSAVTPGWDENSSKDVGPVLARCQRLKDATGAHVMLVHHLNADGTKARGHTSIFANLENVIMVAKVKDAHDADQRVIREAIVSKQKEEEDGARLKFVLPSIQIGVDGDGDKVTSCIVAPPAGQAGQGLPEVGVIIQGNAATVLRAIYEAVQADGVFAPPELNLPQGSLVVDRQIIARRLAQITLDEEGPPADEAEKKRRADKRRKDIQRARELLYTRGIIGINDPWVWLTGKRVKGFAPPPGTPRKERQKKSDDQPKEASVDALPFADEEPF